MSLWTRFILWYNDVCPKHGPFRWGYCEYCYEEKQPATRDKQKALWERHKKTPLKARSL